MVGWGRTKKLHPLCTGWKEVILQAGQGERVGGICPLCLQGWHCYGEGRELFSVPCTNRCAATAVAFCRPLLSGAWSLQYNWLLLLSRMEVIKHRTSQVHSPLTPTALVTSHSSLPCHVAFSAPMPLFCLALGEYVEWDASHSRTGAATGACFFYGDSEAIRIKDTNPLWIMTAG